MKTKRSAEEGPLAGGWNSKYKKYELVENASGKDVYQPHSEISPGAGKVWGERGSDTKRYKDEYNRNYYEEVTKKQAREHSAGSDGNYMTKQNLWLAHRVSEMLYRGIPDGVLLPDWAESKINSATQHLKEVAGWAMHESHGDDLHPPPETNPIHLAAVKTYTAVRDLKWKDGTVLAKGTPVTVTYRGDLFAVLGHDGLQHTTKVKNLPAILKGYPKAPSLSQLQKWSDDLVSKTPTGARVEPDGYGPDGSPSWLLVMGLV